ncbi:MAG: Spy/CpxP family protein refolding chaperone [Rubrivivax sp.]
MKTPSNKLKLLAGGTLLALAAGLSSLAVAAPHGGMGGHDGMMAGPMGGQMVERMLDRVDATPEQRAQIKQITDAAVAERKAQREDGRGLREQMLALFAQPTVDAQAAEALRQQQMARADAGSKRMMQTMLQISQVLTPQQRQQFVDIVGERGEMMQRHQRERRSLQAPKTGS